MNKVKEALSVIGQYLKSERKKILLTSLFIVALVGIPSGVLVVNHLLNNNQISVSPTPTPNEEAVSGEVAGVSTNDLLATPTPTPQIVKPRTKVTSSPTPTPTSTSGGNNSSSSNNNQSNNSSSNNSSSNQSQNNTPTPTQSPTPEPSPTLTPEPTPTPTPDNSPFETILSIGSETITITANKPLQKCQWVKWTQSPSIVVSNNGDGADLISGNVCTIDNNNSTYKFGAKITSIYGEEKILGESPSNDYW